MFKLVTILFLSIPTIIMILGLEMEIPFFDFICCEVREWFEDKTSNKVLSYILAFVYANALVCTMVL